MHLATTVCKFVALLRDFLHYFWQPVVQPHRQLRVWHLHASLQFMCDLLFKLDHSLLVTCDRGAVLFVVPLLQLLDPLFSDEALFQVVF